MKTTHVSRFLLLAVALISPAACMIVPFPAPELSEIRDSRTEFIRPGFTTRREVEAQLTSRDVFLARNSPPYSIYAEYRDSFGIGVLGPTSDGVVFGNVDDYLVVEYDDADRVVRYDRLRREGACTSYGLCVSGGSKPAPRNEDSRKDARSIVVFAPTVDDAAGKAFLEPVPGTCSVYAYTTGRRGCDNEAVELQNGAPGTPLSRLTRADSGGYFHWTVRAPVESSLIATLVALPVDGRPLGHSYECPDRGVVFIEARLTSCGIGAPSVEFHHPAQSAGREEVALRRLILE